MHTDSLLFLQMRKKGKKFNQSYWMILEIPKQTQIVSTIVQGVIVEREIEEGRRVE